LLSSDEFSWLEYHRNALAAGTPPPTPLGELTAREEGIRMEEKGRGDREEERGGEGRGV